MEEKEKGKGKGKKEVTLQAGMEGDSVRSRRKEAVWKAGTEILVKVREIGCFLKAGTEILVKVREIGCFLKAGTEILFKAEGERGFFENIVNDD